MLYQSVALRQTTRRSGFSAGEGAAANGSLTERRSSRQSANYVDGAGETERRSATTEATTHGNDGRQRRTAATDGCDGGRTARLRRTVCSGTTRGTHALVTH